MQNPITLETAGKILMVSNDTLRRYIRDGELQAAKVGKRWLTTEEALERLLAARQHKTRS